MMRCNKEGVFSMKNFKNKKRAAWLMVAVMTGTFAFGGMTMNTTYAAVPTKTLVHDSQMKHATIKDLDNDTRVFAVDKAIEAKKVTFQNRYGFDVAGHLYLPKDFDDKKQYKAVVVTGPLGDVKLLVVILPSLFGHVTGNAIGSLYTFSPYLSFR